MDLRSVLTLLWVVLLYTVDVEAKVKDITCFTCLGTAANPMKCTRPEYQGTFKQCKGEALVPANTCYKSVNIKTGEVNKGCAPMKTNRNMVYTTDVGPNGEQGVKTYYCNSKLCNSSNNMQAALVLTMIGVVVQYFI
eukprot:TRINITY_DN8664_c0_g1_i1.p1 TRINITY_DN8664_c0_g1~~TRINITY_DN8664_c0_g1_i1.p1  ORF type:complete len:137 (+),score=46.33 TRINITY_DN8664_c0_g1_i1:76-486(+)